MLADLVHTRLPPEHLCGWFYASERLTCIAICIAGFYADSWDVLVVAAVADVKHLAQ
jgi:hypothetical protein